MDVNKSRFFSLDADFMDSIYNETGGLNSSINSSRAEIKYESIVTSFICCVGMVGNISNIAVLRMRKTQTGLDYIGRIAILGLLALACSDLMFCMIGVISGLLVTIGSGDFSKRSGVLRSILMVGRAFYYYRSACLNIFLFISTWCITLLSIERYIVVCHPFKSRQFVNARTVIASRVLVSILSAVINFPLFIRFSIYWENCDNLTCIYTMPNPSAFREPLMTFHRISWTSIGTFLPLLLLLCANIKLICEVTKVTNQEIRRNGKAIFHVTKTLVVIAISFIFLVCPSMFLDFLTNHTSVPHTEGFKIAVNFGNICQAIKFSCNFLLYCTINKTFRQSLC